MKITLIMPSIGRRPDRPRDYVGSWQMEPLALATLAGLTPDGHQVAVVDDRNEAIRYDAPCDLAALSVETYTARRAYQIAAGFRRRGVPVVMGGFHPTLVPDEVAQHADAVMVGEAEAVWASLLADLERGALAPRYHAPPRESLAGLRVDRSVYSGKRYLPIRLVETGRGCFQRCDFCTVTQFFGHRHRRRPIDDILAELGSLDTRSVFFVDDNIAASPAEARDFFRALIPLKLRWVSQMTIDAARDEALLDLLVESGCLGLLIGFESLSSDNLELMNKSSNLREGGYARPLAMLRERRLKLYATFLLGYDHDDAASVRATLDFALRQRFFLAAFNHLVPFPGTPIYRRLAAEGRLRSARWWLDPEHRFGDVVFDPRHMSHRQLEEACMWLRRQFYGWRNIARRVDLGHNVDGLGAAALFVQLNLMLRREVGEKRGLPLGVEADAVPSEAPLPVAAVPPSGEDARA